MSVTDNYFLNYHELVLNRISPTDRTVSPPNQLKPFTKKAARGEMNACTRAAALILAG